MIEEGFVMTKKAIIEETLKAINELPETQAKEISDFARKKIAGYHTYKFLQEAKTIYTQNSAFDFLADEEDLYSESDLKKIYHEKR